MVSETETEADILIQEAEIMEKFESLYAENNDLIGWLSIPGNKQDIREEVERYAKVVGN